jgi:hypothetical protein
MLQTTYTWRFPCPGVVVPAWAMTGQAVIAAHTTMAPVSAALPTNTPRLVTRRAMSSRPNTARITTANSQEGSA